ncbi:MAG: S-layer homology domain-containing protein [Clostridia bacterium]|nr:S-layer homology domain-containing protein [Clostridia bacterium]
MIKRIFTLVLSLILFTVPAAALAATDSFTTELSAFPTAWQEKLTALHEKYPEWMFVAVPTGLSWQEVVKAETGKKSLVEKYYNTLLRNTGEGHYNPETGAYTYHDASTWVSASAAMVDYFMNPANFLNETYIFQFEALSYDRNYHTIDGVELILKGTFMHEALITYVTAEGETVETEKTYGEVIMEAAEKSMVSPYYLASKIRTEIGIKPSGSVSGTYEGYEGLYNFYNIGANDGANPIANGLNWASLGKSYGRPWTTPELSIINGAIWIGELYISKGQNTMYFERFNVAPDTGYALYTHQYMTNVYAVAGQSKSTFTGYQSAGTLADSKVFYIPTFKNMPAEKTTIAFSAYPSIEGTSSGGGVNIRSGPSVLHDTVGRLESGAKATVLSGTRTDSSDRMHVLENPYWYEVKVGRVRGYVSASYINLTPSETLAVGDEIELDPVVSLKSGTIYWENTNRNVLSVNEGGLVKAKAPGKATLYAFLSGGGMAAITLEVEGEDDPIEGENTSGENKPSEDPEKDPGKTENPIVAPIAFTDMENHWAKEVVNSAVSLKLFNGTTETTFSPDITMTRAMFITVLGRLYESKGKTIEADISALPYLDVDASAYYAPYVAWAYEKKLLPFGDTAMFSPSAPVTRGEMVLCAYKFGAFKKVDMTLDRRTTAGFTDYADLSSDLKDASTWCVGKKIISGMGNGLLALSETATRAQVAQIMMNLYKAIK